MLLAHFTQPFNSFFPTFYYWSASSATSSIFSESKRNQSSTASRFHFCVSSSLVTDKNKEDNANLWILNAGLGSGCGEGEWSESPARNGSQIHNKAVPCLKRLTVASVHLPHTHTAPKLQIMDSSLQRGFSKESGPKGLLIQATPFLLLKHKDKKKKNSACTQRLLVTHLSLSPLICKGLHTYRSPSSLFHRFLLSSLSTLCCLLHLEVIHSLSFSIKPTLSLNPHTQTLNISGSQSIFDYLDTRKKELFFHADNRKVKFSSETIIDVPILN